MRALRCGAQLVGRQLLELREIFQQRRLDRGGDGLGIAMRATDGLGQHFVDELELEQAIGGEVHRVRRHFFLVGALPENGRAAFRRNHRVGGELQHQQPVANANGQRATRTTLADHAADDGNAHDGHLEQVARDRFGLVALFGAHARIGARRVDESDERQAKSFGEAHEAQRLAITLGLGHAVVAAHALLGVAALLVADEHDGRVIEARGPADDGEIVAIHAVAMQLVEVLEDEPGVVERVGALRMPRELGDLPGREIREDALRELLALGLQPRDLFLDVDRGARRNVFQFFDLGFKFGDRLLEIEEIHCHRGARI